jgi:hypothetical protein
MRTRRSLLPQIVDRAKRQHPDDDDMAIPPTTPIGTSKRRRYVPAAPVKHATAIQTPTSSALPGVVPEAGNSAAAAAGTPHGWRSGACMSWTTRPPSHGRGDINV